VLRHVLLPHPKGGVHNYVVWVTKDSVVMTNTWDFSHCHGNWPMISIWRSWHVVGLTIQADSLQQSCMNCFVYTALQHLCWLKLKERRWQVQICTGRVHIPLSVKVGLRSGWVCILVCWLHQASYSVYSNTPSCEGWIRAQGDNLGIAHKWGGWTKWHWHHQPA